MPPPRLVTVNAPQQDAGDFLALFNAVVERIYAADSFDAVLPEIEPSLLRLLRAERLTIYQRLRNEQEIVSKFKTGDEIREIRVALSVSSIAGYVALNQTPLLINDVYDARELQRIHPGLRFNMSYDQRSGYRSRSMVVVPVQHKNVGLGVLQLLNCTAGPAFNQADLRNAQKLGAIIGQRFSYEFYGTNGPFDYLILRKKISRDDLEKFKSQAFREQGNVARLLIKEAGLRPEEVGYSLEQFYQVPFQPYEPHVAPAMHLVRHISADYLRHQLWVPLSGDKDEAVILIDDPTDTQRILEIQKCIPAERYVFRVGLPDDIQRYLGHDLGIRETSNIEELVVRLEEESSMQELAEQADDVLSENTATVIQLVNKLILEAHRQNASDIHIEPDKGNTPARVRYRVDGLCRPALKIPSSHIRAVIARIKVMSGLDISERRRPQDGKCIVRLGNVPLELRVVTMPTVHGEAAVLRLLAASRAMPLDKLSLSTRNMDEAMRLISQPHGIFLVAGPTGSGKTTTLHAFLGHINTPDRKIWTAEDPVEITQRGLQQVQVHAKIGFTFAAALRSFLRADPDVIMIGEMRDAETAQAGIEASLTGHLVFSTLHTNSAPETLVRLLDLGLDPVSFSDALLGVLAQRLMRTLCEKCKAAYSASSREFEYIRRHYGSDHFAELHISPDNLTLYRAVGCD
ncbi:MAG TPA: GAF domain-containing protein, partial [Desulfonatronum sp.]|nr:GAF domain-containing protein [Desulfonatronum sp.]